jgi:hypothetical protein
LSSRETFLLAVKDILMPGEAIQEAEVAVLLVVVVEKLSR